MKHIACTDPGRDQFLHEEHALLAALDICLAHWLKAFLDDKSSKTGMPFASNQKCRLCTKQIDLEMECATQLSLLFVPKSALHVEIVLYLKSSLYTEVCLLASKSHPVSSSCQEHAETIILI